MFDSINEIGSGILRGTNNMSKAIAPVICSGKAGYWVNDLNKYLGDVRDLVVKRLNEMGDFTIPHLEGTYLMFPKFNYGLTSAEINKVLMKEAKVSLNMGSGFGPLGDGHMRILTATSKNIMNEALDRIEKVIPKLEKMS
jgi:bifunctional pyridoxal-dependent enzyme with beta-cystathionase and maltose regulon repressor activities